MDDTSPPLEAAREFWGRIALHLDSLTTIADYTPQQLSSQEVRKRQNSSDADVLYLVKSISSRLKSQLFQSVSVLLKIFHGVVFVHVVGF
jgi:hypothetical protein